MNLPDRHMEMFGKIQFEGVTPDGKPVLLSGLIVSGSASFPEIEYGVAAPGKFSFISSINQESLTVGDWSAYRKTTLVVNGVRQPPTIEVIPCRDEPSALKNKAELERLDKEKNAAELKRNAAIMATVDAAHAMPKAPPPGGQTIDSYTLEDASKARQSAFDNLWPNMAKVFEDIEKLGDSRERRERLKIAYVLDMAEKYRVNVSKDSMDPALVIAMSEALKSHEKSSKKSKRMKLEADMIMALNWTLGKEAWCWKPLEWIASELNKALPGLDFTASTVKHRRQNLRLASLRKNGPV